MTVAATAAPPSAPPTDRDAKGRFLPGNGGGPGNPFARRTAAVRKRLLDRVTDDDVDQLVDALLAKAKSGDVPALRLAFSYLVGKPEAAQDPDRVDLHEWEQQKAEAQMLRDEAQGFHSVEPAAILRVVKTLRPFFTFVHNNGFAELGEKAKAEDAARAAAAREEEEKVKEEQEKQVARAAKRKERAERPKSRPEATVTPSPNGAGPDLLDHLFGGDPAWLSRLAQVGPASNAAYDALFPPGGGAQPAAAGRAGPSPNGGGNGQTG